MGELNTFILFYAIILYNFALIFGTIGWHLSEDQKEELQDILWPDKPATEDGGDRRLLKGKGGGGGGGDGEDPPGDSPGAEYKPLPIFLYNFVVEFRMSMGDNDFG